MNLSDNNNPVGYIIEYDNIV